MNGKTTNNSFLSECHGQREQVAKSKLDQENEEVVHYMQEAMASKFL